MNMETMLKIQLGREDAIHTHPKGEGKGPSFSGASTAGLEVLRAHRLEALRVSVASGSYHISSKAIAESLMRYMFVAR